MKSRWRRPMLHHFPLWIFFHNHIATKLCEILGRFAKVIKIRNSHNIPVPMVAPRHIAALQSNTPCLYLKMHQKLKPRDPPHRFCRMHDFIKPVNPTWQFRESQARRQTQPGLLHYCFDIKFQLRFTNCRFRTLGKVAKFDWQLAHPHKMIQDSFVFTSKVFDPSTHLLMKLKNIRRQLTDCHICCPICCCVPPADPIINVRHVQRLMWKHLVYRNTIVSCLQQDLYDSPKIMIVVHTSNCSTPLKIAKHVHDLLIVTPNPYIFARSNWEFYRTEHCIRFRPGILIMVYYNPYKIG